MGLPAIGEIMRMTYVVFALLGLFWTPLQKDFVSPQTDENKAFFFFERFSIQRPQLKMA